MGLMGNVTDYFIVFWAGVLVSFTPCVYPLLPLTAAFIGAANTKGGRFTGFVISLVYVLGLAVTYSFLAVAAALTGKVFGQFQNHPAVFLIVGNGFLIFALVMLDVIQFLGWGTGSQPRMRPKNLWMVFVFGLSSGFLIGPCTAPVLGGILVYVASKQNILHAASLLFVFAYGVGTSQILVGTFSGLLARLPKSGVWLVRIKQAGAVILVAAAEYMFIKAGGLMGG